MNKQHFCICLNFFFFLTSLSSGAFCFQCSYIFCSAICRISTVLTLLPLSTFVCNHTMQIKNRHTCMYAGVLMKPLHTCNESFMFSVWGQLAFTGNTIWTEYKKNVSWMVKQGRQNLPHSQSICPVPGF